MIDANWIVALSAFAFGWLTQDLSRIRRELKRIADALESKP